MGSHASYSIGSSHSPETTETALRPSKPSLFALHEAQIRKHPTKTGLKLKGFMKNGLETKGFPVFPYYHRITSND